MRAELVTRYSAGILVLLFAVLGCNISKYVGRESGENANTAKPSPTVETKPAETPKPQVTPTPGFESLTKKWVGKYPYEVKLLNDPLLRKRLQKVMGRDFAEMDDYFNVSTPMEMQDGVFMAQACQAHNCGLNNYYIYIDVKADNINVYHIEDQKTKTYFESGKIKLPAKFAADMNPE